MKFIDVLNFEGLYQISDTGIVKALERIVFMPKGGFKIIKEHFPVMTENKKGYLKVMLTAKNGIRKGFFVHRLVMSAFVGQSEKQVNHIDLDKKNNNLNNLEYLTNRENAIHSIDKTKTSSIYTGVTATKSGNWQSQKTINGKHTYLGTFLTEHEAHQKYLNS